MKIAAPVQDPAAKRDWPKEKGRDAERTPMQWNSSRQAGFSNNPETWLPVGNDYRTVNVAAQLKNPHSVLNYYRKLIELKKTNPQLKEGDFVSIDATNASVLSFLRKMKDGRAVAVSLNMTKQRQTVNLSLKHTHGRALLASFEAAGTRVNLKKINLPPYGAILVQVSD